MPREALTRTTFGGIVTEEPAEDPSDEIRLTLPALASYARVARLAVTGLASRLGFSYDELEDLRIAIGEVFGLLVPASGGRLTLRCRLDRDGLFVEARREPVQPVPDVTELTRQILTAVADFVEIDTDQARVRVVKRLEA